jgi:DNA-binding MarR family transcriptional regulator
LTFNAFDTKEKGPYFQAGVRSVTETNVYEGVLVTLRQIIRAIDLHSRRLVHDHGLTGPQLVLIRELGRADVLSVGELARRVSLSQGTVTGVLDRLEKRGLVERSRSDSDRRRVLVRLTEAGFSVLGEAPSLLQDEFVARFQMLAAWEQTLILSSLQRVASMMGAEDLEAESLLVVEPLREQAQEAVEFMPSGSDRTEG